MAQLKTEPLPPQPWEQPPRRTWVTGTRRKQQLFQTARRPDPIENEGLVRVGQETVPAPGDRPSNPSSAMCHRRVTSSKTLGLGLLVCKMG